MASVVIVLPAPGTEKFAPFGIPRLEDMLKICSSVGLRFSPFIRSAHVENQFCFVTSDHGATLTDSCDLEQTSQPSKRIQNFPFDYQNENLRWSFLQFTMNIIVFFCIINNLAHPFLHEPNRRPFVPLAQLLRPTDMRG